MGEEKSLKLGRFWRPSPIAVLRGPNERYRSSDPTSTDVSLLIEVADSSYATDRGEKWRAYAAARIPIYWIVNLDKNQIEVYCDPIGRGKKASYRQATTLGVTPRFQSITAKMSDGSRSGTLLDQRAPLSRVRGSHEEATWTRSRSESLRSVGPG